MFELGLCLCCEVDEWILCGWVLVDGELVIELGLCVKLDVMIEIY